MGSRPANLATTRNNKDQNRSACQWDGMDGPKTSSNETATEALCNNNGHLPRIFKSTQHFIFARQPRQPTTHVMKNAASVAWNHATPRKGEQRTDK